MRTNEKRVSLAVLLATPVLALCDTFVSSAFTLDMRLENGRRIAHGTETIMASAEWEDGDVAVVAQTPPGGVSSTIHTTSGPATESVSWDAKHAVPGDHLFTHTVSRGGSVVASNSVIFEVPEPGLEAICIFGPTNFYSGNSSQYICMGYFSDDSGRQLAADWSLPDDVPGISVNGEGLVTAPQFSEVQTATLRAVVSIGDIAKTNDLSLSVCAAHLSLGEKRIVVERTGERRAISVSATGGWTAESSAAWLVVTEGSGYGDGVLVVTCGRNLNSSFRQTTVVVTCGTLSQEILVRQSPREPDDTVTVFFDVQGGTISSSENEYVVGEAYGALPFPSLPGKVFGGWWTSVDGQGTRILATSVVTADVRRLYAYWREYSATDALDNALNWMSDADEPWVKDPVISRCGGVSMRSGSIGQDESSSIMTEVTGPGSLSFWWRTSSHVHDWLVFYDNGADTSLDISGETTWTHVEYAIPDSGTHSLKWSYEKWSGTAAGDDCAWLDEVVWTPGFASGESVGQSADAHVVPNAWRAMYGLGEGSLDGDSDGDGMTDWEEYVAGTNPLDPSSTFRISISMEDEVPELSSIPDLGNTREYIVEGKESLADPQWVSPTNATHRFFRAKVKLR